MKKRKLIVFIIVLIFIGAILLDLTNLKALPTACIVLGIAGIVFLPLMSDDF